MVSTLKRILVGSPLSTSEESHQRLGRPTALAVFASDAISSTAYATEEILLVLVPVAALAALHDLVPIAIVVMALLTVVIFSYRQTIFAYPNGGGSYVVSRENLGVTPSQVAGASLLIDYVLTVAVSISAGMAAITSAFPGLAPHRVRAVPRVHRDDDDGQPPRPEGVRPAVRRADVRLHRVARPPGRRRSRPRLLLRSRCARRRIRSDSPS